nr:hypothetical protein [Bacillaceae bacterium]
MVNWGIKTQSSSNAEGPTKGGIRFHGKFSSSVSGAGTDLYTAPLSATRFFQTLQSLGRGGQDHWGKKFSVI